MLGALLAAGMDLRKRLTAFSLLDNFSMKPDLTFIFFLPFRMLDEVPLPKLDLA